jgi:hypothetical protein
VGFLLGFALVAGARLSQSGDRGAQLTSAQALHRGAAVDHVAGDAPVAGTVDDQACAQDRRPVLLLT